MTTIAESGGIMPPATKPGFNFMQGIGRRLLFHIILFSSVITCLGTCLQLYVEYSKDIDFIHKSKDQIETSSVPSLTTTLWVSDYELLRKQLEDILKLPDMQYLKIELNGEIIASVGTPQSKNIILHTFPMSYSYDNREIHLGTLHVVASLTGVYKRLIDRALVILGIQAFRAFSVSMFILLLFHAMVGRHLTRMASYAKTLDLKNLSTVLTLNRSTRKKRKKDELEQLVFSINEMRKNLINSLSELHQSEERLSLALKGANAGMWDFYPQTGKTYFSSDCFTMLGYNQDEFQHNYETWASLIHPDDRETVESEIKDHLKQGSDFSFEFRMRAKNDEWRWVLLKGQCAEWDQHSSPKRILGIHMDINQRKTAEEALRESEERLRAIYEAADNVSFITTDLGGKDARITSFSPGAENLFGYTEEEIIGNKADLLHLAKDVERFPEMQNTLKYGNKGYSGEATLVRKSGERFPALLTVHPIFDVKGEVSGALEVSLDITEQKKAEQERRELEARLLRAQKMEAVGTLAGGIAHDFNNLLMGIQGNASLMLLHIDTRHPYYKRVKNIEKQVQTGARLTSHLLGYARKGKYEIKLVDLNLLLKEATEALGRIRKGISIHCELAQDLLAIEADPSQIEQVLMNLFLNAADAMPGGGDLTLKTMNVNHKDMDSKLCDGVPGNYVQLTVTDTGVGMDPQTVERIFDPFFTTKKMGRGTGLGLASAYGIIKGHGGDINVESQLGRGTTFTLYLLASERKVRKL
jgi:two-component system cell cycle sensor histidine kinase/response regulator CckA